MDRRDFLKTTALAAGGALLARGAMAQATSGNANLSFVVVADPHLREDRANEPTGVEKFRRVLSALEGLTPRPESMLMVGDIHPEKLVTLLPEVSIPIHAVHGNHETLDERKQLREMFPSDFGDRDYYAFTQGGCRFIGLCTATVRDHVGHFESEDIAPAVGQVEWLEQELHDNRALPHRFIFTHIPPNPQGRPDPMCLGSREAQYFHGLLQRHRVSACYFGHLHNPYDYRSAGRPVYSVASCNWNFENKPTGFLHVQVQGDQITTRFIATTG